MIHYYKHPVSLNDIHRLGAMPMAEIEVMKMSEFPRMSELMTASVLVKSGNKKGPFIRVTI